MSDTISILCDHDDFVVVNKPPGISMHSSSAQHSSTNSIAAGIQTRLQQQLGTDSLHVCHRLDTPTSGCLVLAKNKRAAAYFSGLFSKRQLSKFYLALVEKKPAKKQGCVSGDMKNIRRGNHALLRTHTNPAITYFLTQTIAPGLRLVVVKPITGKTHQIRVAMKSLGAPIVGDERYGGEGADRLYLHAWQLHFDYNGQAYRFNAPTESGKHFLIDACQAWINEYPDALALPWPKKALG